MKTLRNVTAVVCLALAACTGKGIDDSVEDAIAEEQQEITGGGCPLTPYTTEDRWYCLSLTDQVTDVYFRLDGFPARGEGPFGGSFTRYNRNYPYKTTGSFSNWRATQAYNGCQSNNDGMTLFDMTMAGQACDGYVWLRPYPWPRALSFRCGADHEWICWEHNGPRAFGGGGS